MKLTSEQEAIREAYKEWTENIGMREDNIQYVYTPYWVRTKDDDEWKPKICECMIGELQKHVDLTGKKILVLNLEFAIVLMEQGVLPENITFLTDCIEKAVFAETSGVKVMQEDFNTIDIKEAIDGKRDLGQFDVVVGNPPYQAPQEAEGKRGGGVSLWDKFVDLALDELLVDNGYLCFVHPSRWRKPLDELWQKMTSYQIHYLEIHNTQDGQKVFSAGTRYDWYVLQKKPYKNSTVVIDENGDQFTLNLQEWPWLPNYAYNEVKSILINNSDDDGIDIIFDRGAYGTDKGREWTSESKTKRHIYPCVNAINQNGIRVWYSSINNRGHFGIPKVIFGEAGRIVPLIDMEGQYGMTQGAMAIPVDTSEEAEKVAKALETKEFANIINACSWSNFRVDWRMFKYFKKDFWKEFLEEESEEKDES